MANFKGTQIVNMQIEKLSVCENFLAGSVWLRSVVSRNKLLLRQYHLCNKLGSSWKTFKNSQTPTPGYLAALYSKACETPTAEDHLS